MKRHRGGPQGKGGQRQNRDVTAQNATCDVQTGRFCLRCGGWLGCLGLEPTPDFYTEHLVQILREVRRVLKPDGTVWINLGDCYTDSGRGADVGSTLDGTRHNQRESRKVRVRESAVTGLRPKNLLGIPWRFAFAMQGFAVVPFHSFSEWADILHEARVRMDWGLVGFVEGLLRQQDLLSALKADGWYLRSDVIWNKPNPMPESVTDRLTKAHEYIFLLSRSERYYFDADAIKEPAVTAEEAQWENGQNGLCSGVSYQGQGSSTRKFSKRKDLPETQAKLGAYRDNIRAGKSGNKERKFRVDHGGNPDLHNAHQGFAIPWEGVFRNKRSVWTVQTQPYPDAHFATFPPKLIEPCILAGSRPGDTVLDPFHGAGTTAKVAKDLGRNYVGSEIKREYIQMSTPRLRQETLPLQIDRPAEMDVAIVSLFAGQDESENSREDQHAG